MGCLPQGTQPWFDLQQLRVGEACPMAMPAPGTSRHCMNMHLRISGKEAEVGSRAALVKGDGGGDLKMGWPHTTLSMPDLV